MADGYARATRRPAFLNLHIAAGLANGLSMVLNARRARTPLVVTAGQQDRRHLIEDPMLGGDLVAIAQGAFKEAVEVTRVEDLPVLMRRAFLHAAAPPAGPVLVSIPVDVLEEEVSGELPARSRVRPLGVADGVEDLADALLAARAPAIVAGDGVGREGAVEELVRVAEALGATVFHEPMYDAMDFPATHVLSRGMLPPVYAEIRERLEGHDVVFLVGSHAFSAHYYTPVERDPRGHDGRAARLRPRRARPHLPGGDRAPRRDPPDAARAGGRLEGQSADAEARINAARARRESEHAASATARAAPTPRPSPAR